MRKQDKEHNLGKCDVDKLVSRPSESNYVEKLNNVEQEQKDTPAQSLHPGARKKKIDERGQSAKQTVESKSVDLPSRVHPRFLCCLALSTFGLADCFGSWLL